MTRADHQWRHVLNGLIAGRFPRVCVLCLVREDRPEADQPCDRAAVRTTEGSGL